LFDVLRRADDGDNQLGEGDRARTVLRDSVARSVGRRPALPRVRLRRR
jgi:hypothetical protein